MNYFAILSLLVLVLAHSAQIFGSTGFSSVSLFSDSNCSESFDGADYGVSLSFTQWTKLDLSQVFTQENSSVQNSEARCVTNPFNNTSNNQLKEITSGQYTCANGLFQNELLTIVEIMEYSNTLNCSVGVRGSQSVEIFNFRGLAGECLAGAAYVNQSAYQIFAKIKCFDGKEIDTNNQTSSSSSSSSSSSTGVSYSLSSSSSSFNNNRGFTSSLLVKNPSSPNSANSITSLSLIPLFLLFIFSSSFLLFN